MNQHPVPQNVTQYQFRLVGDMTLKQFLELAAGIVLAALFYSSNLLFIFKAPLILLSILFGVGLAFFPIEDRPLDQWIVNFFTAIYKPTRFTWKKTNKVPNIFTFTAHPIAATNTITKTIKAPTQRPASAPPTDLSQTEDAQIKSLNTLFSSTKVINPTPTPPAEVVYDKPQVTVRKLSAPTTIDPLVLSAPPKAVGISISSPQKDPLTLPATQDVSITQKPQPTTQASAPIPENLIFSAAPKISSPAPSTPASTVLKSITLPVPPRTPNLIVGVTTTPEGKLVEGAIVQVLDGSGVPARAMKTNALGQFATSTPLSPGTYRIEVEADDHTFPAQQLVVNDTIIQPFEITASA